MAERDDHAMKHLAAFLGAPVGGAALGTAIWLGLAEDCSPLTGVPFECVRYAGGEYGLGEVAFFAGIVALVMGFLIEILVD